MGDLLMQKARAVALAEMIAQRGQKQLLEVGGAWGSTWRLGGWSHGKVGGALRAPLSLCPKETERAKA